MKKGILCAIAALMGMTVAAQEIHLQVYNPDGTLSHSIPLSKIDCYKIEAYQAVDLGLPSGTQWATFNVGATAPHEAGGYYAWGMTSPIKGTYNSTNCTSNGVNISEYSGNATYDAATANWGSEWRTPTQAQMNELRNTAYCTWEWASVNGINGYKVTSVTNGNSIFLPAAGHKKDSDAVSIPEEGRYWTSTPNVTSANAHAFALGFREGQIFEDQWNRYPGRSIRPVTSSKSSNTYNFMNIKFANGQTRSIPVDDGLNAVNISGNQLNVSYTYDTTGKFYEINQIDQITFSNDAKDEDITTSVESLNGTNAISINHDSQSIIVSSNSAIENILIFNVQGKLMTQIAPNSVEASMSIANFPAGMYIIKVLGSESSKIQKIIIH